MEKPYTHREATEALLGSWVGNWCNELALGRAGPAQWFQPGLCQGFPVLNLPCSWKLVIDFGLEYFEVICESNFLRYFGAFVHILWSLGFIRLQNK